MEVDFSGNLLKTWNFADIISAAMRAGGDDPSQFVYPAPTDWFHNNAATYDRANDSLIVSSRENFVICIDYNTSAIKWILGDPAKKWYQFPSLRRFALTAAPGSLPPIGQHGVRLPTTSTSCFLITEIQQVSAPHRRLTHFFKSAKISVESGHKSRDGSLELRGEPHYL